MSVTPSKKITVLIERVNPPRTARELVANYFPDLNLSSTLADVSEQRAKVRMRLAMLNYFVDEYLRGSRDTADGFFRLDANTLYVIEAKWHSRVVRSAGSQDVTWALNSQASSNQPAIIGPTSPSCSFVHHHPLQSQFYSASRIDEIVARMSFDSAVRLIGILREYVPLLHVAVRIRLLLLTSSKYLKKIFLVQRDWFFCHGEHPPHTQLQASGACFFRVRVYSKSLSFA